ncbi:MAG: type II toxin-antitoxin system RelB/DinJ family antitoxin [Actinomycetaceae bacterium]|nr:type II toxin-antitoxin system RelB/DinJ family antitoxin [Actinomycetaceae bacterium]
MPTATMNIRIDADVKTQVEEVSKSLGLNPTAVFNVFARSFIKHRGFPFPVVDVPTEKEFTQQMEDILAQMMLGKAVEHELLEDGDA